MWAALVPPAVHGHLRLPRGRPLVGWRPPSLQLADQDLQHGQLYLCFCVFFYFFFCVCVFDNWKYHLWYPGWLNHSGLPPSNLDPDPCSTDTVQCQIKVNLLSLSCILEVWTLKPFSGGVSNSAGHGWVNEGDTSLAAGWIQICRTDTKVSAPAISKLYQSSHSLNAWARGLDWITEPFWGIFLIVPLPLAGSATVI